MAKKANYDTFLIDGTEYLTHLTSKFRNRKKYEIPNDNLVEAVIPGTINKIFVKEGQKVRNGAKLLILEAMKMRNVVVAPKAGIIKSINTEEGKMVPKGKVLIEIE